MGFRARSAKVESGFAGPTPALGPRSRSKLLKQRVIFMPPRSHARLKPDGLLGRIMRAPLPIRNSIEKGRRRGLANLESGTSRRVPYSRFVTDDRGNMRPRFSIPIDRFGYSCTLLCPDRILSLIQPKRVRIAIPAHLLELEPKHHILQ